MADNKKILMEEIKKKSDSVVEAVKTNKPQSEVKALRKAVNACVAKYNLLIEKEYYKFLAEKHGNDAVKVALAVAETQVPGVISIQFRESKDGKFGWSQGSAKMKVDLVEMSQTIGMEYFHSADWFNRIQILSRLIALALNKDLGDNPAFQYIIDDACENLSIGEQADPKSASTMVKAFQKVVDDILWVGESVNKKGEPVNDLKFTTKHWAYVNTCMSRQGSNIGDVVIGSPMKTAELVVDCINMMLNKKDPRLVRAD